MTKETTIVVVGATGNLGRDITRELTSQPDVRVRALARAGRDDALREEFGDSIEIHEGALGSEHPRLVDACRGASAVVSVVQGGPDVIVDGQLALLRAAAQAGVRRFIPSDFSYDIFAVPPGRNVNTDWRRAFAERAPEVAGDVELVHMLNGCFLDMRVLFGFLGMFDLEAGTMALWGEGHAPIDFTTYADTARYTALAATRAEVPTRFEIAGDVLDFWELKQVFEAQTERPLKVVEHGSLDDLDAEIERRRAAEPDNVYAWLPLMYLRVTLSGEGKLKSLVGDRFPEISPTTVARYISDHRGALTAGLNAE